MSTVLPDPPLLPFLSTSLHTTYSSLRGGGERSLFKRLYLAVWRYLWPISRIDPVALAYMIPDSLELNSTRLTVYEWFMLCRLIVLTDSGSHSIDTMFIKIRPSDYHTLRKLKSLGFITRTTFNPADPYGIKPSHITNHYITLNPSGVQYYRGVVKQISKLVHNDLFAASTGAKQKGQ